jgi:hypothetical protein
MWVGLADVVPNAGNESLGSARGAYVKVLVPADSEQSFREAATKALQAYDFWIKSIEDIFEVNQYLEQHAPSEELAALVDEAQADGGVHFGAFHSYKDDETLN